MRGKSKLYMEFWEKGKAEDCPVYDIHGHMGTWRSIYFPFPEPEDVVRRLDMAGVELLCFSHHAGISSPDILNSYSIEAVKKFPTKLRAYCAINPNYHDITERELLDYQNHLAEYIGFKFHPDMNGCKLDHIGYRPVWEYAEKNRLIVLSHTWGGSSFSGEEQVRKAAKMYPNVKFILGHSLYGNWDVAIELAASFENLYLDLCGILKRRDGVIELLCRSAGSEKILYGTDMPWFSQHYYIGAVLAAEISEDSMRNILYRNARRILSKGYDI